MQFFSIFVTLMAASGAVASAIPQGNTGKVAKRSNYSECFQDCITSCGAGGSSGCPTGCSIGCQGAGFVDEEAE